MRPFPGSEGKYLVTSDGRIWSVKYRRFLEMQVDNKGYFCTHLQFGKRRVSAYAHKAVALAWIANPHEFECVNHIDGNKTNNLIQNLEWCSKSHDVQHSWDSGLRSFTGRTRTALQKANACASWAKLSMSAARAIRWMRMDGYTQEELATLFNVTRGSIQQVIEADSYKEALQ